MPRIPGVDVKHASLFIKLVYKVARRQIGKMTGRAELIEPIKVMAHRPRILFGISQLDSAVEAVKLVPHRFMHLAMLRVATLVGCPF